MSGGRVVILSRDSYSITYTGIYSSDFNLLQIITYTSQYCESRTEIDRE